MQQAYLILTHHGLEQLEMLVDRLLKRNHNDIVAVHMDRRAPISNEDLAGWASHYSGRVRISRRVSCRWGHYSLVRAMVNLIETIDSASYDYAHLISGQDWPIVSVERLRQEIEPGRSYLNYDQPDFIERMTHYHFNDFMLGPNAHRTAFQYRLDLALRVAGRVWTRSRGPRHSPFGSPWCQGSQWWSLPRAAIEYSKPRLCESLDRGHLRYTKCSDEHVMQTVLAGSRFADQAQKNRRFVRWSSGSSPDILVASDAAIVRASDAWFMRKVDVAKDDFFLSF